MAADKEPINYDKDYSTKYDGVYFRYSRKRRHNGKPDKSYKIRYRVNGRSKNERIGWQSDGITAEFARNIRADRIVRIQHGEDMPDARKLTFGEAAKRYLDDHHAKKSIKEDVYRYNDLKHMDDIEISKITLSDLKKVHTTMRKRGVKHATYIKVEELFNKIVKYVSEINLIKPQTPIKVPSIPRGYDKVTEIYTDDMLGRYMAVMQQYPYTIVSDIMEFIVYTGMRRSEPLKLKWSDYNERENYVIIRDAKSGRDEKKVLSNKSQDIIERQKGRSKEYIFEKDAAPVRAGFLSYHARRMADMAGLPKEFRPLHSLRHNYGTRMALQGAPAIIIKEALNHKNLETTQRYLDVAHDQLKGHVDTFEDSLKSSVKVELDIKRVETNNKND